MSTITLKKIPASLHRALKSRAKSHGRSLNHEIISYLKAAVQSKVVDVDLFLKNAQEIRRSIKIKLTQQELSVFKSEGRP